MNIKRLRDVLLVLISVIILILLIIQTQSIDSTKHNQYSRELRRLNELDAILNQDILKLRVELLTYYDPLVDHLAELKELQGKLDPPPSFIDLEGQSEIKQLLEEYNDLLNEKERLIDSFKSDRSVLNNSLGYLPEAVTELADQAAEVKGEEEFAIELKGFLQDVLVYNLTPNEELAPKIEGHINSLQDNQQNISVSSEESEIDMPSIIKHARIILEGQPEMEALIEEIVSLPTSKKGDDLFNAYNRHYQGAVQSNNFYRLSLYLFSLFLVASLSIYIINKFRHSALALKQARQKAEHALWGVQQAEEKYRSIFENAGEGIFQATVDPAGRYLSANPALSTMYGYDSPEELMDSLTNLQKQLYVDSGRRSALLKLMEDEDAVSGFQSKVYRKDKQVIWICENVRAVRDENGDLLHHEGVIQDVTARKKAEEAQREYSRKLEQEVEQRTAELAKASDEKRALNERLLIENVRLEEELDMTRQLHQTLLPTPPELQQIEGLQLAGLISSIEVTNQELYDVFQQHTQIQIGLGTSKNSVTNGVLILMTRAVGRTLLTSEEREQRYFLSMLTRAIDHKAPLMPADQKLSLALLNYQSDSGVKLGAPYKEIIVVRQGGMVTLLDSYDLGFSHDKNGHVGAAVELEPIEGIILYTGAITGTENMQGSPYTLQQLSLVISRHWSQSAEEIVDAVIEDLYEHIEEPRALDNLTLVILKQENTTQIADIVIHNDSTQEITLIQ